MIDYGLVINIDDLPAGYRFLPSDAQLINCYLNKKVNGMDVPANVIQDIDASEFYFVHPSRLVKKTRDGRGNYFFVHMDNYFNGVLPKFKEVGNGIGFWKSIGNEQAIYDENGRVLAYKINVEYVTKGRDKKSLCRTLWRMKLWRLNTERIGGGNEKKENWVLGWLKHGNMDGAG